MKIISLSALTPQSGKDTLADFIESIDGLKVKRMAFSDALRTEVVSELANNKRFSESILKRMINTTHKDTEHAYFAIDRLSEGEYKAFLCDYVDYNPLELTSPRSLRYHLQKYGDDYMKEYLGCPTYWIDIVRKEMDEEARTPKHDLIVITDCRSPLEFKMLKRRGAHTFLIDKVDFPPSIHDVTASAHRIETYSKDFAYDWALHNIYGDKKKMEVDFLHIYNNFIF